MNKSIHLSYIAIVSIIGLMLLLSCKQQSSGGNTSAVDPASIYHYEIRQPSQPAQDAPLLILIHGRGSNELDLHRFSEAFTKNMIVVSPRAPITVGENRFSWYPLGRSSGSLEYDGTQFAKTCENLFTFTQAIQAGFS